VSLHLNILNGLIEDQILMHRAEKLGLLATDDEVERKLSEYKAPYTSEQFEARLREKKMSLDDFKRDIRRSLTMEKGDQQGSQLQGQRLRPGHCGLLQHA
jgi:peptidyl-prolyl cis-trans isomerase SurA